MGKRIARKRVSWEAKQERSEEVGKRIARKRVSWEAKQERSEEAGKFGSN